MKNRTRLLALCLARVLGTALAAHALDNQFTYQGRLTDNSSPATATYQMQFRLRDGPSEASAVLATMPSQDVPVVDGLFSVSVDFPVVLFDGSDRWLEISVAPPATPMTFSVLLPRQKITPTPYALYAAKAGGLASGIPLSFSDKVTFSPASGPPFCVLSPVKVDHLNSDLLDGLDSTDFWQLTGNTTTAGQFLGTLNPLPLELRVNNTHAWRAESTPGTPNLIGGAAVNVVAANTVGSVIAGGGVPGEPNGVSGAYNAVGGGLGNRNDAARYSFLGGGHQNGIRSGATSAFLGGGASNVIGMPQSGVLDAVQSATLAGGEGNIIQTRADFATIPGGRGNWILPFSFSSSINGGEYNIINGPYATIGGGAENAIRLAWEPFEDTEMQNLINGNNSVIAGGYRNQIIGTNSAAFLATPDSYLRGYVSTISGGQFNTILTSAATIAGGNGNTISYAADFASIGGGYINWIGEYCFEATIGGGREHLIHTNSYNAVISGGRGNVVEGGGRFSTIAGGRANMVRTNAMFAAIGGGSGNSVSNNYSTVPGGQDNTAEGRYSFAAGHRAKARHNGSFLWADSTDADFVSTAADQFCIRASGGVCLNNATSLSFGNQVRQMLNLWNATYGIGVQTDRLYFRSENGFAWFREGMHNDARDNPGTGGTHLMTLTSAGLTVNGTFVSVSDRNAKENFQPVNARAVLAQVAALPLSRWNYKDDEARSVHLGPMAQDFQAAFALGADDKHIATVDADGVALAAIQGLHELVREKDAKIRALEQRLSSVEEAIASLRSTASIPAGDVLAGGAQ